MAKVGRKRKKSLLEKKIENIRWRNQYEDKQKQLGMVIKSFRLSEREIEFVKAFLGMLKEIDPHRTYEDYDFSIYHRQGRYYFTVDRKKKE